MQIAQVFAGYTLGQADLLRRAMGKKIKSEMAAQRETFIEGAVARGVARSRAAYVFELVDKFAGYGFNKAHSVGYALIAYQTAWLKANHPVAFFAASMSLDRGNADKLAVFRQELDRLGIDLRPPDINASGVDFTVEYGADGPDRSNGAAEERGAIRYALAAVRNVGAGAMAKVVAERGANGRFADLFDFAERLDPAWLNKRQIENLARAGAFDRLDPNRRQVSEAAELLLRHAGLVSAERITGQSNLFGEAVEDVPTPHLPAVDDCRRPTASAMSSRRWASTCRRIRWTPTATASRGSTWWRPLRSPGEPWRSRGLPGWCWRGASAIRAAPPPPSSRCATAAASTSSACSPNAGSTTGRCSRRAGRCWWTRRRSARTTACG